MILDEIPNSSAFGLKQGSTLTKRRISGASFITTGQHGEVLVNLGPDDKEKLAKTITELPYLRSLNDLNSSRITAIELLHRHVPITLARSLIEFRRNPNRAGTIIIRNLPIDPNLPETPADGRPSDKKQTSFSEYCLMACMLFLGEPISYLDEKEGVIIQNICPVKGQETKQENTGSSYLEFHMEDGFHPYKPDYLGLICLRADKEKQAKTISASIRNVISSLPFPVIRLLNEPLYRLKLSSSFGDGSVTTYSRPIRILSGHWLHPDMCIDHFLMEGLTSQSKWALDYLKTELMSVVVEHALEPGDLMIVDNRMAAHGRTSFQPLYDGHDRWLQRMFVVRDHRSSSAMRRPDGYQCTPLALEEAWT